MKLLLIGDPHVVAEELADCERLMDLVEDTIKAEKPDEVVFMGDLHHNHAVIALDVMAFWKRRLEAINRKFGLRPFLIVGNHDRSGDSSNPNHALLAYEGLARVVEGCYAMAPTWPGNQPPLALLVGYTGNPMLFDEMVKGSRTQLILCHETFNGAKYENGFYAPEGIDPSRYADKHIISGHIHTPQRFANVTYIGAPRWRTVSDADVKARGLVIIETTGVHVNLLKVIPTDTHCRPIRHVVIDEASFDEYVGPPPKGPRYIVDIYGSVDFIKKHSEHWKGARIRTFPTRLDTPVVSESEGISKALGNYLTQYQPRHGANRADLAKLWVERVGNMAQH